MNFRNLFYGIDTPVLADNGRYIIPINFDNGATTPPLKSAVNIIGENLKYYSSIERSTGIKGEYCTKKFEDARDIILDFFNAKKSERYSVVYIRSTTEGLNLLASVLMRDSKKIVLSTRMEHHANDLPWRYNSKLDYIDVDKDGRLHPEDIENKLKKYNGQVGYVTLTGASNVTGYVNNINAIAEICHKYGAAIIVDAAQLVAHREINLIGNNENDYIDFLVFSAHKAYAPFGSGAIIGLTDILNKVDPFLKGGGIVERVFDFSVLWTDPPQKLEAGTQNFFGVIAMAAALKELKKIGFDKIQSHEDELRSYIFKKMLSMNNVELYGDTQLTDDRLGIITFNFIGIPCSEASEKLAKESGISLRCGRFCAHPYADRLMGIQKMPDSLKLKEDNGMMRASLGLYNTMGEANIFIDALENFKL